ncbi:hypothetical protein CEV32_2756 [Brucella rhizosphaerae]|uniref:Uncharacterized protein n=1 Tax=Brucella rhizosphaerae TaxID=571254 RepID=A0A256EZN5_9HYPH|nr:hypothetical protein CEV32_2756 [Brucella rhizosphaerae]
MFNAHLDHFVLLNPNQIYLSCCQTDSTRLLFLVTSVNTLVNLTRDF